MTVTPLRNQILVKPDEQRIKQVGKLIIPPTVKSLEGPNIYAEVISIGPGKRLKDNSYLSPDVKIGDRILLAKYAGTRITVDETVFLIVDMSEVMGVVE